MRHIELIILLLASVAVRAQEQTVAAENVADKRVIKITSDALLSKIETAVPQKEWLSKPVTLSLQKETTGEIAPVSAQGTCNVFGITLQSTLRSEDNWIAWILNFEGTKTTTGYTLTFDLPVSENASHIFTPTENGTADLSLLPAHKPAQYGTRVFPYTSSYVLPLVSVFDANNDIALSIALPADENIPHLQVEWFDGKTVRFTLKHRGIGKGRKSPVTLLFTTHPADYRSVIAAYAQKYPQWFEPVMPTGKIDGAFWYHHIMRRPTAEELKRQNVRYLWSSFWFTHLGNYLPQEKEWYPYTYAPNTYVAIPGEKMSDDKINAVIDELSKENISLFAYFNVTEYGGKGGEGGDKEEANRILREQFANALVKDRDGNAIETWEGAMAMNANEKYALWPFLEEQVRRHISRIPQFEGFLTDRLDWASVLDYAHDDGLTMDGDKTAENLAVPIRNAIDRVGEMMHEKQKRFYVNQFARVEPLKNTDGYCHEKDFLPLGYLSPYKPLAAWFATKPYSRVSDLSYHEAHLKKRLQIAMFPQLISHEFPVSQQQPDPVAADFNEIYTPLFAPFVGKRQVLMPHCISASGDNDCNLFTDKDGNYVIPLTSRSRFITLGNIKTESTVVTVTTADAGELRWAHVIPAIAKPYKTSIRTENGKAMISLDKHGSASVIIAGKGIEPQLPNTDYQRLAKVCNKRFPKAQPDTKLKTAVPPRGKIRSAEIILCGKNFYHNVPFEVAVNDVKCGTFASDSCKLSCNNISLQEVMKVSVKAADDGAWWLPSKALLVIELENGLFHAALWNNDDVISASESTALTQVFDLQWVDAEYVIANKNIIIENDLIQRKMLWTGERLEGVSYRLTATGREFMRKKSPEFSVMINDSVYTGLSRWTDFQVRDTLDPTGGHGKIITLSQDKKGFAVEIAALVYPHLPVVYKTLRVINTGKSDLKVEALDVENFRADIPSDSWIMKHYARDKTRWRYTGNWDDPLVIVHNPMGMNGIAIGNMALSVTKRTSVFNNAWPMPDGTTIAAGLTHPDQDCNFRRWLRSGETYTSPGVFTAIYENSANGSETLNLTVPDFIRRHADMRIERLPKKPMFVYNTWVPFGRNINDSTVYELARAAADCGVEEFVIDDGWQIGPGNGDWTGTLPREGDWSVDPVKFPNGLRPVFDYIKSLGMKPGLWLSLAWSNTSEEHPEWFVRDRNGQLANLHTESGQSKTACMATDWYDYIKAVILKLVSEHGLGYVKLDLAIVTSAYVYDNSRTGCYATDHPLHRDHEESFEVIYRRCMSLFDDLHREAPDLFIDCTFETAGKLQLMDYGIAKHAEGNWLSNVGQQTPVGPLRVRNLAWGRTPALPATSLVIGNLRMDAEYHRLGFKSLAGSLPIMLGDPRKLTPEERQWYKTQSGWLKELEKRHGIMSFRQDLPGFGEPTEDCWDGFCRINTETGSGGLVGIFRHGAKEEIRTVTVPWLNPQKIYTISSISKEIVVMTGKELAEKGFSITIPELYGGELFEINEK